MPHPPGARARGRAQLLAAVGRGFRAHGLGGIGVDGLARGAGLTSGAFYAHFPSKSDAFVAALDDGMQGFIADARTLVATGGDWPVRFVDLYLGDRRTCPPGDACPLQSLAGDVARAGDPARACFEARLAELAAVLAEGLATQGVREPQQTAMALLSLLAGAVTLARATRTATASEAVADSARLAAHALLRAQGATPPGLPA